MQKSTSLRAAAIRRVNRQAAAVTATVRAWQALKEIEKVGGDAQVAMKDLRAALENLEHEMEKA
jgi:hypothetical protein